MLKTFQFPTSFWKKSNFSGLCAPCSCSVLFSNLSPAGCPSLLIRASHNTPIGGTLLHASGPLHVCFPFSRMLFPGCHRVFPCKVPGNTSCPQDLSPLKAQPQPSPVYNRALHCDGSRDGIQVQNQRLLSAASGCTKFLQEICVGMILSSPPGLHQICADFYLYLGPEIFNFQYIILKYMS